MIVPRRIVLAISAGALSVGACAPRRMPSPSADATTMAAPWLPGEPPPLVAGVRLGDSLQRVRTVLGAPPGGERELVGGARALEYGQRGLMVVTTEDQGIAMLGLLHPGAPVVHGVRVGDPVEWMEQQWGPMHRRAGEQGTYVVGRWGVMVSIDTTLVPERVRSITFGWSTANRSIQLPAVKAPDIPH